MTEPSKGHQQDPLAQQQETTDSGEETPKALSPSEQIAQYIKEKRAEREAQMPLPQALPKPVSLLVEGLTAIITLLLGGAVFIGLPLLLLRGCDSLQRSTDENREKALRCASAGEDLDQIKRLRDNGFAGESAVRVMERKRDEACTW